ncbi:MAG: restriction endonuclease subunit S, partial [Helicobacteraceae bacterium]|nr:restriction endonuclease subunit S [Helicobacteraceae bacterium]
IGAIEKLIAKKRAIKQGVMQQLLTGKRRLTGFNSQWTEKNINDLGNVITGRTPSTANKEYWNGSIAWVTPTDISFTKNIYKSERMVTECGIKQICELPPNTLLVTCIASIGKNTILRVRGATNQQINAVIPFDDFDVDFLYYVLEINKQALLQKAGQTATNIISKTEFSTIVFKIPPTLAEQQAIAKILSDIDAQIDALIAKLNKAKNIKQGIAQKLLTGKIRLPQRIANG